MRNFKLTVYVQRRPHMRCPNLEYLLNVGLSALQQMFDKEEIDPLVTKLELMFPERWLNIVEERSLLRRLEHFYPNLTEVKIYTQSVYILQCVSNKDIVIISSEDECAEIARTGNIVDESVTGRLWYKNAIHINMK